MPSWPERGTIVTTKTSGARLRRLQLTAILTGIALSVTACASAGTGQSTSPSPSGSSSAMPDFANLPTLKPDFGVDAALQAQLPAAIRSAGKVDIGMSVGLAPINFPGSTPETVRGLNDDLATGLETLFGITFSRHVFPSTASQLLAVQSQQVAFTISTNGDTKEREQSFDFIGYMLATNALMVAKGNPLKITTATDLCGRTYGEVKGGASIYPTLQSICKGAGKPVPTLSSFEDVATMQTALAAGRIDGYAGSDFSTQWQQFQGAPIEAVPMPETGTIVLGMTFPKGDTQLRDAMLAGLKKLQENGFYDRAFARWGLTAIKIDPAVNNGAQGSMFG